MEHLNKSNIYGNDLVARKKIFPNINSWISFADRPALDLSNTAFMLQEWVIN